MSDMYVNVMHEVCLLLNFISDTVYIKFQYVCVVRSIIGRGVQRVVWERRLGKESDVPMLTVCMVCGWVRGWWSFGGGSLASTCWLYKWCLSVWRY